MTCSARLPVYALLVTVLFPGRPALQALAFTACYALGALDATHRDDFRAPFRARLPHETVFAHYGDAADARTAAAGTASSTPVKPSNSAPTNNARRTAIAEMPTVSPMIFGVMTKPSRP